MTSCLAEFASTGSTRPRQFVLRPVAHPHQHRGALFGCSGRNDCIEKNAAIHEPLAPGARL